MTSTTASPFYTSILDYLYENILEYVQLILIKLIFNRTALSLLHSDTQRTITRRDSSLINQKTISRENGSGLLSSQRPPSSGRLLCAYNESTISLQNRPRGSIQKELITRLFETMLDTIVESWQVIAIKKTDENLSEDGTDPSQITQRSKRRSFSKPVRPKRNSKLELTDGAVTPDPTMRVWWSAPDERAIIKFKNGNEYEGGISMKSMHGEGRFKWADGTVYLGNFKDNEISGQGKIQWKDDTWYEGEFQSNIRHGHGLYVDSRKQRSYAGNWQCGTKHGKGIMYYSKDLYDSYDGDWVKNIRHGFGAREYCKMSGYKGEWDNYARDGKGLMIWPNHDFYRGDWKNGIMSGHGIYIWNANINFSLSTPALTAYRGNWFKGQRNGFGLLNLGTGMGAFYKGEYKNNKKHGAGKLVTTRGLILKNKRLFYEDNMGPFPDNNHVTETIRRCQLVPYHFEMYDDMGGLLYHIQQAYVNLDRQDELRDRLVNNFITVNKSLSYQDINEVRDNEIDVHNIDNLLSFEEEALHKALRCYEPVLREIYYSYSKCCNDEEIRFTPVLIRLYLWQFYYDCNIHQKGLTLIDIDNMLSSNPDWLIMSPHNPFEKIYYWQFMHSLVAVARKLYASRELPGPKPETIVASALRKFIDTDILPNVGTRKGHLINGHAKYVPLQGLYKLYNSLGEPHSVRTFLCAVLKAPHGSETGQPELQDMPFESIVQGFNAYVVGDVMAYVVDDVAFSTLPEKEYTTKSENYQEYSQGMKLFNFSNLSSKCILGIFSTMFPGLCEGGKFVDIEIQMTFFEFFEAFMTCALESMKQGVEESSTVKQNKQPSDIMTVPFTSPAETPRK